MKKLILVFAVAGIVSLAACKKSSDVVCENSIGGITTKVTVSEDEAESCVAGFCQTTSLGSTTQADYVESLEAAGYTCK
jgi:hypothetical protein